MRVGTLFISVGESVMGWFAARASGQAGEVNNVRRQLARFVLPIVKRDLEALGFTHISIHWDNYAGCTMCPCSPGYAIAGNPPTQDIFYMIKGCSGRHRTGQAYAVRYDFEDGVLTRTGVLGNKSFGKVI